MGLVAGAESVGGGADVFQDFFKKETGDADLWQGWSEERKGEDDVVNDKVELGF